MVSDHTLRGHGFDATEVPTLGMRIMYSCFLLMCENWKDDDPEVPSKPKLLEIRDQVIKDLKRVMKIGDPD